MGIESTTFGTQDCLSGLVVREFRSCSGDCGFDSNGDWCVFPHLIEGAVVFVVIFFGIRIHFMSSSVLYVRAVIEKDCDNNCSETMPPPPKTL